MIKYIINSVYVIWGLILVACSANPTLSKSKAFEQDYEGVAVEETDELPEPSSSVAYEFEEKLLSDQGLKAFEQRAMQKVIDCGDYFILISDKSLDSAFIDQAKQMLVSLFINERVYITVNRPDINFSKKTKLNEFIRYLGDKGSPKLQIKVDGLRVTDSLDVVHENKYTGEVMCVFHVKNSSDNNPVLPDGKYDMTVQMESQKIIKQFGTVQKHIWEVFLGNITLSAKD